MIFSQQHPAQMDAVLFVVVLALATVQVDSLPCKGLVPPQDGVLKCQYEETNLLCTATCNPGLEFQHGMRVVTRVCVISTGLWYQQNDGVVWEEAHAALPSCFVPCYSKLLSSRNLEYATQLSASSAYISGVTLGPEAALLVNTDAPWRAANDDVMQFIQVDLGSVHRLTGIVIRGDRRGGYVKIFRLLFSFNGLQWNPYSGRTEDQFFTGNFDSVTEVTMKFDWPQAARYVRINPLSWEMHVTLQFDLLGCPATSIPVPSMTSCRTPEPPHNGAVNCERNQTHLLCTAFCRDSLVFEDHEAAIDVVCDEQNDAVNITLPPCVEPQFYNNTSFINISGMCLQQEGECRVMPNGDYQFCGNCHYFSTCSEGYLYVRPCPEHLHYDSQKRLCNYQSSTCKRQEPSFVQGDTDRSV